MSVIPPVRPFHPLPPLEGWAACKPLEAVILITFGDVVCERELRFVPNNFCLSE